MSSNNESSGWHRVLELAKSGEIALDPTVGKELDAVCDAYLNELKDALDNIGFLATVSGFGPLPSGQALQAKFAQKASGSDLSLEAVIKQHIDSVQLAKQAVARAIANIDATDQSAADRLSGIEVPQ